MFGKTQIVEKKMRKRCGGMISSHSWPENHPSLKLEEGLQKRAEERLEKRKRKQKLIIYTFEY